MDTQQFASKFIAGEKLYYTKDVRRAISYLMHDLSRDEAEVFFIAARTHGDAPFEDDHEGQYRIRYKHGKYYLESQ